MAFGLSPQQRDIVSDPLSRAAVTNAVGSAKLIFDPERELHPRRIMVVNPGGAGNFSLFASGGNGLAYIYDTSQELTDTLRYNVNLLTHYDVTDNIRLFGEFWYGRSKSTNLATQPEYNSDIFAYAGSARRQPGPQRQQSVPDVRRAHHDHQFHQQLIRSATRMSLDLAP